MKTHLANSSEPLKEGTKILAICGAFVPNAKFVFMWDETQMGAPVTLDEYTMLICRTCCKTELSEAYTYGIREPKKAQSEAAD